MTPEKIKSLMSILLIATAVLHIIVAAFGAPNDIRLPLAAFGAIYGILGVLLLRSGRPIVMAAMAACALGIVLGGGNYLQNGGPATLPVMFLIDVLVIAAGAMWLAKNAKAK